MRQRFTAGLLTVTLSAGLFTLGVPGARASSKGRRNTALGLGAVAAYELLTGKTGTGLLAGAGAAYAYSRYRRARRRERRHRRYYFPARYYGTSYGRYLYGSPYPTYSYYSYYPSGPSVYYVPRYSHSYATDEWSNRHYYSPRYRHSYHGYEGHPYRWSHTQTWYEVDTDRRDRPSGWSRGVKRGWRGHSVPPGHWRRD